MSKQRLHSITKLVVPALTGAALTVCADAEARPPQCVAFEVAEMPFRACVDTAAPGGGFSFHGPGQSSPLGGLLSSEGKDPFFLLNTDFETGVSVGGHAPPPSYFSLTLRWDSVGPREGVLALEVCGPEPVAVRLRPFVPQVPRGCGRWMTLIKGLVFPDHVRVEPPAAARRR
jgi:hypothetical protein